VVVVAMIRRGITEPLPEAARDHPLFGADAQAKLRAIAASDVWQGLRAGLEAQREALLSTPLNPATKETLEERWGAIQQLSLLLHGGPQMILQHTQLAANSEQESSGGEYLAKAAMFEG
jgi:hypothetical protein